MRFRLGVLFRQRDVGGILQRLEAERHGLTEGHDAAHEGPAHPLMFFREAFDGLGMVHHFFLWIAHGNTEGVRGAHHDALEHRLPADERFFAALQGGEQLDRGHKSKPISQCYACLIRRPERPAGRNFRT